MAALAPIGLALGLGGTAMSTYANVQASKAEADAAELEARSVEQKAQFLETQQRRRNLLLQGEANATAAASGVAPTSKSLIFLELDRIKQGELEAQSIKQGGMLAAQSARFQGQLAKKRIPGQIAQGFGQGGSILTQFIGRKV